MLRPLPSLLVLATSTLSALACSGGDGTAGECEPETTEACVADEGCRGTRTCGGYPTSWTECECTPSSVGARCTADSQCRDDELCLGLEDHEVFGGSLPEGVCSRPCDEEPSICETLSPLAVCVEDSAEDSAAYCLQACELGDEDVEKCRGRTDMYCRAAGDGDYCRPFCQRDADCESGACDLLAGVCVDTEREGDVLGTPCDPDADEPLCEGACVELGEFAYCSHRCRFGERDSCADESSEALGGLCFFPEPEASLGDAAFCAELCDCDTDCTHGEAVCDPLGSESIERELGAAGVCSPPVDMDGNARDGIPCP